LNPRKAEDISKQTAKDLELDPILVEHILKFYWKNLRKMLVELNEPTVLMPNLGSFKVRKKMLKKRLKTYSGILAGKTPLTFTSAEKQEQLEELIRRLQKLTDFYQEEANRKQQFKLKKHQDESNQNMEKQGQDS